MNMPSVRLFRQIKKFKNPLARPRGFLIYYAIVRHEADLIFEKRQLEIKENYNVTR